MPTCDGQDVAFDGRRQMVACRGGLYVCGGYRSVFYVARVELAARDVAVHDVVTMSFK